MHNTPVTTEKGHHMASVNRAILIGNLGRDPEVRYIPSGDAMATLSLATTDTWKSKDGEKQEKTEWHRVTALGKLAEIMGEYLKKGSQVYIEGSIHTRKYTDKDGVEKYSTEIRATEMKMLGGKERGDGESRPASSAPRPSSGSGAPRTGGGSVRYIFTNL